MAIYVICFKEPVIKYVKTERVTKPIVFQLAAFAIFLFLVLELYLCVL